MKNIIVKQDGGDYGSHSTTFGASWRGGMSPANPWTGLSSRPTLYIK